MDNIPSMPSSMETVAAGMAGFALASLLSFARKPQVAKQDPPATSHLPSGGNYGSNILPKTPILHFPGMGHDFHVLARLVAEKQQSLNLLASCDAAEESLPHTLKAFGPQLAELSNFEWRANLVGQNYPGESEMVGRNTRIVLTTVSPPQSARLAGQSSIAPLLVAWSENGQTNGEPATAGCEANKMRSIENAEESPDRQHNQRRRKCCRRDEQTRTRRQGWRRGRDEDPITGATSWGWTAPCEDYHDGWGWSRYREESYN